MSKIFGGIDIGGTKCAVVVGRDQNGSIDFFERVAFPTPETPELTIERFIETLAMLVEKYTLSLDAIGISVGGPLNSRKGLILSPPNLPGWDEIDIITPFENYFKVPTAVQNDANACALAEWKWGAGKGSRNMVFLTFGTGMGAGLILDGKLYSGTSDMAGEVGHLRLDQKGPVGFGKAGSFEGFCSGGGIARYAQVVVKEWLEDGKKTLIAENKDQIPMITAKTIGEAANQQDELAIEIYAAVGKRLGQGLSILLDVLNPEVIVIGSIFQRQEHLLRKSMLREIEKEALIYTHEVCQIVPALLADNVGDYAALSVAALALEKETE